MTLTLPIKPNTKYRRRDGQVIATDDTIRYDGEPYIFTGGLAVFVKTGKRKMGENSPYDLVADHIEPVGHVHAASMLLYAQDAAETDEPWKRWEGQPPHGDFWSTLDGNPSWVPACSYRRKPPTIRIGDFDVPEPLRDPPADGTPYYFPNLFGISTLASSHAWRGGAKDMAVLTNGLAHLDPQAAHAHAVALLSFTKKTDE